MSIFYALSTAKVILERNTSPHITSESLIESLSVLDVTACLKRIEEKIKLNEPGRLKLERQSSWQCLKCPKLCSDLRRAEGPDLLSDSVVPYDQSLRKTSGAVFFPFSILFKHTVTQLGFSYEGSVVHQRQHWEKF